MDGHEVLRRIGPFDDGDALAASWMLVEERLAIVHLAMDDEPGSFDRGSEAHDILHCVLAGDC
jgi:hypothetical protein